MNSNLFQDVDFSGGTTISLIVIGFIAVITFIYLLWVLFQNVLVRNLTQSGVLLEIVLEKDTETTPAMVEQMWSSFYNGLYLPWYRRILRAQPYLSFEIKSENDNSKKTKEITFNIWVPTRYASLVKQRISSLYHNAQINTLDPNQDYIPSHDSDVHIIETAEMGLSDDNAFAIKTLQNFDEDPLNAITAAMSDMDNREIAVVQVMARPMSKKWRKNATRKLHRFEKTGRKPTRLPEWTNAFTSIFGIFFRILDGLIQALFFSKNETMVDTSSSSIDKDNQRQMLEKVSRNAFSFQVRILVGTPYGREEAQERLRNIMAAFKELDGPHNGLKKEILLRKNRTHFRMKDRFFNAINNDDILSTLEMAGFCHLPNKNNYTQNLKKVQSKRAEFSADIASDSPFAYAIDKYGNEQPIGLDQDGRMRHIYVSGMTGVGKSTILENMIAKDIEANRGVVVIDPHGELVDEILKKISTKREDVFVLDPADMAFPFGLNLLEVNSTDPLRKELEKVLVVDAYITAMKRVFGEASIGANTDDLFRMSCSAILDHPEGGGLLEMLLMLTSDVYRSRVLTFVKDPIVRNYWEEVYPALAGQGKFLVQNLNAPLNKIRRFIANPLVSNIICQQQSTLNIADAINNGSVILARFSRGDMGFENSALLGTMLISKIQIAAMQRVNIPQSQRVPTYLYVDEFQNFGTPSSSINAVA